MKKLIVFFLLPIALFAQNNKGLITYNYFAYDKGHVAKLFFKPGVSLYKLSLDNSVKKVDAKADDEGNKVIMNVNFDKDVPDNLGLLTSLKNKDIIEQIYITKGLNTKTFDTLFVKENTNVIKWEITDETKKIDKFLCQKAIASFRGRVFNAWFTSEIPVSFGPWKLNGLPGLILEVYDIEKKFIFSAEKIEFTNDVEINEMDFLQKKYISPIEKRAIEYNVFNNTYEEIMGRIKSKLPRGVNMKEKKTSEKIVGENIFLEINFDDIVKIKN